MCVLYLFVKGRKNIGGNRDIAVDNSPFIQQSVSDDQEIIIFLSKIFVESSG